MKRMIFVNLPVADVDASRRFYTGLGFTVNDRFSDEQVACVVISHQIVVMLIERSGFAEFIATEADARTAAPVLNCLSSESRQEVDDFVARAVASGGTARTPIEDGEMYGRAFTDPDGHVWEVLHMEVPAEPPTDAAAES